MQAQHKTRDVDDNDAIKSVEYEQRKTEKDEHRASKIPSSGMVKRSHFKQINQNFTSIRALWTHSLTHTNKNPPAKTFISESGPHEYGGRFITIATTTTTTTTMWMKSFMNMLKLSHFNRFKSNFPQYSFYVLHKKRAENEDKGKKERRIPTGKKENMEKFWCVVVVLSHSCPLIWREV